ncbi:hypothetical protein EHS13_05200 [Paenibacillus psychroresistens]|uniref:Uncharacterized protein n=1 Tax=Paenibacillus psychroresistens TaxID=1778678 RepID=A0A6B8RFJ6_9BACL|nr:hypothetical protein [Paenibacillus psychroresistens]QGQ94345.1 hypothetical protein EHS13_05200 [Paenibacillus psychroresistens]
MFRKRFGMGTLGLLLIIMTALSACNSKEKAAENSTEISSTPIITASPQASAAVVEPTEAVSKNGDGPLGKFDPPITVTTGS